MEDINAAAAELKNEGIEITEIKMGADQSWQCWFKDPDGTPVKLHEYTGQSSQRTGKPCVVDW